MRQDFFGVSITGAEATMLKFKLMNENVVKDVERALIQGGSVIATAAKRNLETIAWTVRSNPGYWRGAKLHKTFFPMGTRMIGHWVSGDLLRSIIAAASVSPDSVALLVGVFPPGVLGYTGTDVPYAPYVEALPDGGFLMPAYNRYKDQVERWCADAILVRITKIKKEVPQPEEEHDYGG